MKNKKIQQRWYCSKITLLVVLFSFCMFVVHKQFKRNLKLHFNDKVSLVKGYNCESVVLPVLDCLCSSKAGDTAYNNFSMHKKNEIVTDSQCANVTSIQQILVNNHFNLKKAKDFFECYVSLLPFFKTQNDAFGYVNLIAFKRHQSYSFLNIQSLKSTIYA